MKKISIYGILILISISPLFRGLFFSYEASVFLAGLSVLSAVYFFIKLKNGDAICFSKWNLIFGVLLLAAYALSFFKAVNIRDNIEELLRFAAYFVVSVVIIDYYRDKKDCFYYALMIPVVIAGFICSIIGLELMAGGFEPLRYTVSTKRLGSTFQYANTASVYFSVCMIFVLVLISSTRSAFLRSLYGALGNTIVFAFFMTGSRGGYVIGSLAIFLFIVMQPSVNKLKCTAYFLCMSLPIFISIRGFTHSVAIQDAFSAGLRIVLSFAAAFLASLFAILGMEIKVKTKYKLTAAVVFLSSFIIMAILAVVFCRNRIISFLPPNIVARFVNFSIFNKSVLARLEFYGDALQLISANWLLGIGGGGWTALYQSVQDSFYTARAVHNHFLQVFVEAGILGFAAFSSSVVYSIFKGILSFIKARERKMKVLISGLFCAFLSLMLHSAMDFNLTYVSMSLLFWMLIAGIAIYGFTPDDANGLESEESIKKPVKTEKYGFRYVQPLHGKRAKLNIANKNYVTFIFIAICSSLISLFGLYALAAYNGNQGLIHKTGRNYTAAAAYYEEAYRLDPANPEYSFELAKLYSYFASRSSTDEDASEWREKARVAAKECVSRSEYYPAYVEVLARTYFDLDEPLMALESTERLVKYQPCNESNYELLARAYLEAALYYFEKGEDGEGREMLAQCIMIDGMPIAEESREIQQYVTMALNLLGKD